MADDGQKFLKIYLTILTNDLNLEREGDISDQVAKLADDGTAAKRAKGRVTDVKQFILLAIVPDIPETHHNMNILFELTTLKLLLISIGKQTATVMFPCPYCQISLTDLRNKDPEALEIPSQEIEALTFGHLIKDLNKFEQVHKGNKSEATFCGSMINPSPLKENDAIRVLDKCPPDELHLLEGFVNHSFFKGIVPILGYNPATKWPTNLGIVSKDYHGELFEGNA